MDEPAYKTAASQLWDLTLVDWHAIVSYTLTEPVCAIIDIDSDDDNLPKLNGFIGNGDVNDSIRLACEYMLKNLDTFYKEHPERKPPEEAKEW